VGVLSVFVARTHGDGAFAIEIDGGCVHGPLFNSFKLA